MFRPIKVIDLELSERFDDVDLGEYQTLLALVRLHGEPLGFVRLPGINGRCPANLIRQTTLDQLSDNLLIAQLKNGLNAPAPDAALNLETLFHQPPPVDDTPWPLVTVAVCTRDRTANLAQCLDALERLDYNPLDLLVVDNAPSNGETEMLVKTRFPRVRYVCEPQPGLNWARNRAILEARGEIIAFTDDDVIVDPGWARALARLFLADADIGAVTGLVVPYELETEAQQLFENYGGFARGFTRQWYRTDSQQPGETARRHGGTGKFGTGANMAYRRRIFDQIGYFDVALDVGTVTNGGGDLDMFFRVLKEGHTLVYEPAAIVWHRHRRDYEKLKEQIRNNGIGFYAFLVRNWLTYPAERWAFFLLGVWWFGWWSLRRLVAFTLRPFLFPRELVWVELTGSLVGLTRYQQARRHAAQTGGTPPVGPRAAPAPATTRRDRDATAVRLLDLAHPIPNLDDVAEYRQVALYVSRQERPLGQISINNDYHPLSALQLRQAIAEHLNVALLAGYNAAQPDLSHAEVLKALAAEYGPGADAVGKETAVAQLPPNIPISIVIATYDRPDDLRRCLTCIQQQTTSRPVETIVVDNNPDSQKPRPSSPIFLRSSTSQSGVKGCLMPEIPASPPAAARSSSAPTTMSPCPPAGWKNSSPPLPAPT
jgi:O-antigen biosynthesis protein